MRKLLWGSFIAVLVCTQFPGLSLADWGVSVDLPVSTTLTSKSGSTSDDVQDGTPSGLIAAISFPGFLAVGLEDYSVPLKKSTGLTKYEVSMVDLLFNLPIPVVKVALGVGAGTADFRPETLDSGSYHYTYQSTTLTQYVASIGFSILPTLDIHLGYRQFSGIHKVKTELISGGGSGESHFTISGTTASVGVGFTF